MPADIFDSRSCLNSIFLLSFWIIACPSCVGFKQSLDVPSPFLLLLLSFCSRLCHDIPLIPSLGFPRCHLQCAWHPRGSRLNQGPSASAQIYCIQIVLNGVGPRSSGLNLQASFANCTSGSINSRLTAQPRILIDPVSLSTLWVWPSKYTGLHVFGWSAKRMSIESIH